MTKKRNCYVRFAETNRTLLLGLGNTIRYDDAVGVLAVRELKKRCGQGAFDIMELSETGLHLLSLMEEYPRVIIIDSFTTAHYPPGHIHRYDLERLCSFSPPYSSHQLSLPTVLRLAKSLHINVPQTIVVYGLEIEKNDSFGEGLSPLIARKLPQLITAVEKELYGEV